MHCSPQNQRAIKRHDLRYKQSGGSGEIPFHNYDWEEIYRGYIASLNCGTVHGWIKVLFFNVCTIQVLYSYVTGTVSEIQYLSAIVSTHISRGKGSVI